MTRHSFSVLLSESSLEATALNLAQISDASLQRFSAYQQTSLIFPIPDLCNCNDPSDSLGVATVLKTTSTNDMVVSVGQWLFELSLGSSAVKGLGAGLLTLEFCPQNYNFGSGAQNQIVWADGGSTNGVNYATLGTTTNCPNFNSANPNCFSMIGAINGPASAGPYLNADGVAKLTYFKKAFNGYAINDILLEIEMDL